MSPTKGSIRRDVDARCCNDYLSRQPLYAGRLAISMSGWLGFLVQPLWARSLVAWCLVWPVMVLWDAAPLSICP